MKHPGNNERNQLLKSLYKKWPEVRRFLKAKGCSKTDAEDIFQEALLIFIRKMDEPNFELTVEPIYYVKNTCKFIWYNESRRKSKHHQTELHENFSDTDENWILKELQLLKVEKAVKMIGKQCQQILQLFYVKGKNMREIAEIVGLRNDKVAKVQKHRCVTKVKGIVLTKPVDETVQL